MCVRTLRGTMEDFSPHWDRVWAEPWGAHRVYFCRGDGEEIGQIQVVRAHPPEDEGGALSRHIVSSVMKQRAQSLRPPSGQARVIVPQEFYADIAVDVFGYGVFAGGAVGGVSAVDPPADEG